MPINVKRSGQGLFVKEAVVKAPEKKAPIAWVAGKLHHPNTQLFVMVIGKPMTVSK